MLTGARAVLLGAVISLAGCVGFDGEEVADPNTSCQLEGAPLEAPEHREAFNLTADHRERFPVLLSLFEDAAHVARIECTEGTTVLQDLQSEGADVKFLDQASGHNVYLTYGRTTLHVSLTSRT